jgi:anaerobic ribonucleoside-triphosphate reductase
MQWNSYKAATLRCWFQISAQRIVYLISYKWTIFKFFNKTILWNSEMSLSSYQLIVKRMQITSFMQDICITFKIIVLTLNINKIHWLHTFKQHESHLLTDKIREIIVISLFTQTLQHKIIQKELVINSQLYDAHLHDHDTQIQQCFNCEQWDHTQSICEKTDEMQHMCWHTSNHELL